MSKVFPKPARDPASTEQEPMSRLDAWFEVSEMHAVAWAIEMLSMKPDNTINAEEYICRLGCLGSVIRKKAVVIKENGVLDDRS